MKRVQQWILCVFLCIGSLTYADPVEILFSPNDHLDEKLIEMIDQETTSIKAAVYFLMHRGIAKAIRAAQARGVQVDIVVDSFSVKSRSPLPKLVENGVNVYVWQAQAEKGRRPMMHHKFCILGDHTVWTGSFNFTKESSDRNRENVVVMHSKTAAAEYLKEFDAMKDSGSISLQEFMEQKKK